MRLVALDISRFVAAMGVVLYHYTARHNDNYFETLSSITQFGYLGVPLFFIISGFVITLSAKRRSAFEFGIARFLRLYPAFWAGIAFTCGVSVLFGLYNYSFGQVVANLTMLNDYLGYQNIDNVYWTLQAELKFYACIFILLFVGLFENIRGWLTVWLLLTALHLLTGQPFFMGWFISPSYSSYFIAGVAFYLIHKEGVNYFNLSILLSSFFISCVRSYAQAAEFMQQPEIFEKLIAVGGILIFYLFFFLLVTGRLSLPRKSHFTILGGVTYPLYLIHNKGGKIIIDNTKIFFGEVYAVVLVIMFMLICSLFIHVFIEQKIVSPVKVKLFSSIKVFKSRWQAGVEP